MIDVCGLAGGAVARLFVWGSDYLNKKQTHDQDMERMRAETDLERAKADANIGAALAQRTVAAPPPSVPSDASPVDTATGYSYIDALNSAVRPALTYWYCMVFYSAYKICLLIYLFSNHLPITSVATEFDTTMIGSMIAYWFTDRTFHRLSK